MISCLRIKIDNLRIKVGRELKVDKNEYCRFDSLMSLIVIVSRLVELGKQKVVQIGKFRTCGLWNVWIMC